MGTPIIAGNRVLVTTTTTGTGTYQLGAAPSSYFTFAQAGIPSGSRVDIVVMDSTTATTTVEITEGVYTAGSPATITRAQIKGGTNGSSAVNWGAGTKYILLTVHADRTPILDTDGKLSTSTIPDALQLKLLLGSGVTVPGTGAEVFFAFGNILTNDLFPTITAPVSGFTIPAGMNGRYRITVNMDMTAAGANSFRGFRLYVSGAVRAKDFREGTSGSGTTFNLSWEGNIAVGDTVTWSAVQNSGSALTLGGTDASTFSIVRVKG
jgi:hypothetical protein